MPTSKHPPPPVIVKVDTPKVKLTPRQTQVLAMVAIGMTNAEIGYHLNVSPNRIRNILVEVMELTETSSRTAAVVAAIKSGYLRIA